MDPHQPSNLDKAPQVAKMLEALLNNPDPHRPLSAQNQQFLQTTKAAFDHNNNLSDEDIELLNKLYLTKANKDV